MKTSFNRVEQITDNVYKIWVKEKPLLRKERENYYLIICISSHYRKYFDKNNNCLWWHRERYWEMGSGFYCKMSHFLDLCKELDSVVDMREQDNKVLDVGNAKKTKPTIEGIGYGWIDER